jgi:hypothetical protein
LSRTLSKIWWLLGLCGILDAMCAAMNLLMMDLDGSLGLRRFASATVVWDMGMLALAAGACVLVAGLWNGGRSNCWLLSLHGLALSAFGLIAISPPVRGPLSFRPISLLFVLMSVSMGVFALRTAQSRRTGVADKRFFYLSGAASFGFAVSFMVFGFGGIRLEPHAFWVWMSLYFGLCALFLLYLALRAHGWSVFRSGPGEIFPPIQSPRHAH